MRQIRKKRWMLVMGLLALLVPGCGPGGDDDDGPDESDTAVWGEMSWNESSWH